MHLNLPCSDHQLSQAQFYQLLRSDQRIFDFMQSAATDGLWYLQADKQKACWFNQQFWQTLGYSQKQYPQSSHWLQSLPPEAAQQTTDYLEQLLKSEQGHKTTLCYRHTSGHSIWLKSTGCVLRNAQGEAEHLLIAHTDITNIKKKELFLTRCNHEARIGYWDVDLIHQQIFWSEMTCEIHGVPAGYQPELTTAINFFEAGWSRNTMARLFDAARREGQSLMMYGTHMEISERKETEKRIQKLLELSNTQNERLKNFARIVTHNLRSHAGGINGLLKVTQKRHPELYSHEIMGMLQKAADNLAETIQELTEVASADLGTALAKSQLPLREIVSRVLESLQSQALQQDIKLLNEVPENFTVNAIPAYLSSLVLNFATNAIKYHAPQRHGQLQIQAWREGHWDVLAFVDNGLGIDLEQYGARLFQMYQTFHTHEDSRSIGLYLTKTQVEAMGGKITVESHVGEGSCFKVYLPVAEAKATES